MPVAAPPPLPDQKTKGWEFTDLTGLEIDAYAPAEGEVEGLDTASESLDGPVVMSLAAAAEQFPEIVEPRLGSLVPADDPFVARNTDAWTQGAFIYVPKGKSLDPVQLAVRQLGDRSGLNWRVLIVLEEGAEAEVWETYTSADEQLEGLFNGVVEIVVGAGATLRYISRQELSDRSWVFGTQRAEVDRDGTLDWVALGFGSAHGKVRMETRLAGAGSSARVTGAYAGNGTQHLDFDTTQEHAAPNTTSDLAFRGVLTDSATAVWRGMIRVDPGAQQTDAFQESRNLLLSKKSHADAIPGLEIEANDVRCTHAAAVAQVDAEQLYYLRSRGLGDAEAKGMIIDGFLQELVERLAEGPIRDTVSEALETRLAELLA
ncbi:MAG: Fe-S cluster assembly protein SufD [Solirubrobacterales bacterium]|jgi:Fe-S cluster assembly protein SufD|nr:Fe-S cluster assembly protein SufD [Solirubrobacterales bacterium]